MSRWAHIRRASGPGLDEDYQAFCDGAQPDDFPDLVTSITGKIGLTQEQTAIIDLKVTSSYDKSKRKIKTKIEIGKECAAIVFMLEKASYEGDTIRLNWDSIAHSVILDQNKKEAITLSAAEKRFSIDSTVSVGKGTEPEVKSALLRLVFIKSVVASVTARHTFLEKNDNRPWPTRNHHRNRSKIQSRKTIISLG